MQELKKLLLQHKKQLLLAAVLAAVVVICLGSNILSLFHNKLELRKLARQSVVLDQQYEEMLKKMALLQKQDLAYVEEIARTQYNMVKPGEIQFRLTEK